jgi:predicted nucleic acid-binding protein
MAAVEAFFDTNILLYAASSAADEEIKAARARDLILSTRFGTSIQVVQEFYVNASGKLARNIPPEKLDAILTLLLARPLVLMTPALFKQARNTRERYRLQYWDAAVIAAAKDSGATTLYSEDLNHGQEYEGIRVINPFLDLS